MRAITPMKDDLARKIRATAASVDKTHPETVAAQHLRNAATLVQHGQGDGAKRHLDAAMELMTPRNLMRHGITDDEGHATAKTAMHQMNVHRLGVMDIQDAQARNSKEADAKKQASDQQDQAKQAVAAAKQQAAAPPQPPASGGGQQNSGPGQQNQPPASPPGKQPAGGNQQGQQASAASNTWPTPILAQSFSNVDLAYNPAEPRGLHGEWATQMELRSHIFGLRSKLDRSGLVAGRTRQELGKASWAMTQGKPAEAYQHLQSAHAWMNTEGTQVRPTKGHEIQADILNTMKRYHQVKGAGSFQGTIQAAGSMPGIDLSARTAMLEHTPAPYGKPGGPGLYGKAGNKHSDYFEQIVTALMTKRGMDKATASKIAWGALRKWSAGGGSVHPEVRAAASGALVKEAAAGARAALSSDWDAVDQLIDLASSGGHHIPGTSYDWRHGYIPLTGAAAQSHFRGHVPASWHPSSGSLSTGKGAGKGAQMTEAPKAPAPVSHDYVVARVRKTYGTLGRKVGPADAGKTFIPHDNRKLTLEAAQEGASVSNDRARPHIHGFTHVAVHAEPIPGTNRYKNLDHPANQATIQSATPLSDAIELGWKDAWKTEDRGKGGQWVGELSGAVRDLAKSGDLDNSDASDHLRKAADAIDAQDQDTARQHLTAAYSAVAAPLRGKGNESDYQHRAARGTLNQIRQHLSAINDLPSSKSHSNWDITDRLIELACAAAGVIELAASDGRHIPGTSYDWRHGYIPLTGAAAQSHFRGHIPASWHPSSGSLSTGKDKGTVMAKAPEAPSYVKDFRHPDTAAEDVAMRAAMKAEDYDAAASHAQKMARLEKKAGASEDMLHRINGTMNAAKMIKRAKQREATKDLPQEREREAGKIAETASQVITQRNMYTKTTPEQAQQVRASLNDAAAALRTGDHEGALAHLTAAGEAAKGPNGTSVLTSGFNGRNAPYRIADHQQVVQQLASRTQALAKFLPQPR